ncbi:Serine/threonine-protein kinase mph1 [Colletotrichum siamense]|nr:Serine/threonine-protein kinase mph1 [Colletotrichum siamense]
MAVLAPTSNGYHFTVYTAADIQRFLGWQEKISEAIAMLESNIEVMKSLMRFYTKLEENRDFDLRLSCTDDIEEFCNQLCNMVNDFTLQISRARALVKLTGDRGELIKQHRLERLNQNMEREAIMVRIVTIVTLIYLPATFVSTFFSTDIIKYQGQDSPQGNFSPVAMERWLQILEPTKQDPASGMEYYEFAVKAYLKGYEDIYKLESEAFRGFNNTTDPKSLGVVTYLGEYTLHNRGREQDLDEYLADTYPPVLNREIIAFWEGMFHIAKTLARIHQLEHVRGHSIQKYVGWHGDIKPDNILRVRGKFKLADFGFTRFEKSTIGKPQTTHLLGGTRTYGAPERDTSEGEDRILFSTTIDTWSLGCVFSAVATWVVLGSQGYENYGEMRVMAHEQLKKRHTADPSVSVSACIDAFHDGSQVLPAVLQWHDYLRNSSRKADTITCQVLDLIETGMLEKDPEKRLSSADLCTRLDTILIEAKATYQNALQSNSLNPESQEILSAMLELDKRAPKFAGPRPRPATESNGTRKGETIWAADNRHDPSRLAVARSSRVKKSERIDKILRGKIANREEVIQSGLIPEAIFELPNDERNISTGGEAAGNPSGAFRTTPYAQGNGVNATISSNEIPRNREYAPSIPAITYVYSEPDPAGTTHPGLPELVSPVTPTSPTQQPERFSTSVPVIGPLAHRTSTFRTHQEVPIVQQYKRLHAIWNKNNKWWAIQREVPQDEFLSQFIDNRDIVFVVDNAASMSYHWPDVTTTLLSLAMKIGTLDKDGLDLKFTIGEKHNVSGAKEWTILNKFSKSLESVGTSVDRRNMTNMATALLKIFDDYQNHDKKQTLIILTDGMWEASEHEDDVANAITDFIKTLRGKLKKGQRRWFTIQFVSFGADERALERLRRLDDDLERLAEEDVVDWKPWDSVDPDMLIIGSIDARFDGQRAAPDERLQATSSQLMSQSRSSSGSKRKRFGEIFRLGDRR